MAKKDFGSGFDLIQSEKLPAYDGTGYLFRHRETGMEVFQVVTEDPEFLFCFMFPTPAETDCGTAHIVEHCVLAGSERFPQRDPFNILRRGSAGTYLNAFTGPNCTKYPGATTVKKDFDNIFEVYADAVFRPLLRKETFMQEGIRPFIEDGKAVRFDGVVFNEMQGGYLSRGRVLGDAMRRIPYKGTALEHYNGGIADAIPRLTYEDFLDYYRRHYHPSSCRLFIYGNLPVGYDLDFLAERYLSNLEFKRLPKKSRSAAMLKPKNIEGKRFRVKYAAEEGGKRSSVVEMQFMTDIAVTDYLNQNLLVLAESCLFGGASSLFYKEVMSGSVGNKISYADGTSCDNFPYLTLNITAFDTSPEDTEEIVEEFVKALKKIVKKGIPKKLIFDNFRKRRFYLSEIQTGMGTKALDSIATPWIYGGSPFDAFAFPDKGLPHPITVILKNLKENPRYLEDFIEEKIINNPNFMVVTESPDPNLRATAERKIQKRLPQVTEEVLGDERRLKEFVNDKSLDERGNIGFLTREDLKGLIGKDTAHPIAEHVDFNPLFTRGIVYFDGAIDVSDFTPDELRLLRLYTNTLMLTGTEKQSHLQFSRRIQRIIPSYNLSACVGMRFGSEIPRPMIRLRFKCLEKDYGRALRAICDLLLTGDVADPSKINLALTNNLDYYRNLIPYSGEVCAIGTALSTLNQVSAVEEIISGIGFWGSLEKIAASDAPAERIAEAFLSLRHKLSARKRLYFHITADSSREKAVKRATERELSRFDSEPDPDLSGSNLPKPVRQPPILYEYPGGVCFNSMTIPALPVTEKAGAAEKVFLACLRLGPLWDKVRVKGGAYGVNAYITAAGPGNLSSLRDPNCKETFRAFKEALDFTPTETDVEEAIMSWISFEMSPRSPETKAWISFSRRLEGVTYETRVLRNTNTTSVTLEDILACRDLLKSEEPAIAAIGPADKLREAFPDVPILRFPSQEL